MASIPVTFVQFPYRPVEIDAPLLPPMTELSAPEAQYTWAQARDYLQIHHTLQEITRTHAEIASASAEGLAAWLLGQGIKGKRDDCGECPLANYYLQVTQVALAGMKYKLEVEVRGLETVITIHPRHTDTGLPMGLVRITLPNSPTHVQFIKSFDFGQHPALDEAPPDFDDDDESYDDLNYADEPWDN